MIDLKELYQLFLKHPKIGTDSRNDLSGCIFFALSGDNFNGNQYASDAFAKGAVYAVIDDANYAEGTNTILVKDTLETLRELAMLHRQEMTAKVIGITGTNGKTTTKELIASVLQTSRNITFTSGNLNNHIGVPLSILKIKEETEIAVIEMGANHVGEIAHLCSIAQPDVGIITNIGKAHLEGFGSYEGVIRAKSELYEYLRKNNGKAIVNADDELLMKLSEDIERFTYGSDLTGHITSFKPSISIQWTHQGENYNCSTKLYGKYNFNNVLCAIASGLFFNIKPEDINNGISSYEAENNRSQRLKTETNNIYLDAYNANPVSMTEAIRSFEEYSAPASWLILGDMFELGRSAAEEHLGIIEILQATGFSNILLVGNEFYKLRHHFNYPVFKTANETSSYLEENPIYNTDILIKGSRGMKLESLLNKL